MTFLTESWKHLTQKLPRSVLRASVGVRHRALLSAISPGRQNRQEGCVCCNLHRICLEAEAVSRMMALSAEGDLLFLCRARLEEA